MPTAGVPTGLRPADRHGHVSPGTNAEYVAALIGRAPFFLETNPRRPRTFGLNQLHVMQVALLLRGRETADRGGARGA